MKRLNVVTRLLLGLYWNWLVRYQIPVEYVDELTNTETLRDVRDGVACLIVVEQHRMTRVPRAFFWSKSVYMYRVKQYMKDGDSNLCVSMDIPEFSSWVFRNTKVPYVLAVNAFLQLRRSGK